MHIYVDFNAETSDGRFFARTARLVEPIEIDELVQLYDADENNMVGVVDEFDVERGIVYLKPDWKTWLDGPGSRARG